MKKRGAYTEVLKRGKTVSRQRQGVRKKSNVERVKRATRVNRTNGGKPDANWKAGTFTDRAEQSRHRCRLGAQTHTVRSVAFDRL